MEKRCLVIMPSGDPEGYAQGHFNRVYDYLIVPACRLAGFTPVKVDDIPRTHESPLDIIKGIIECEMAICDLSARNPNVVYGFAVRQVFNLPVTLMKDMKTKNILGTEEFSEVAYDESLRIDTVQKTTDALCQAVKNMFGNKGEINPLLTRLGIGLAQFAKTMAVETDLADKLADEDEDTEEKEIPLPIISPLPDYVGDPLTQADVDKLKIGDFLFHITRGKGKIASLKNMKKEKLASLQFESGSTILVVGATEYFRRIKG